MGEGGTGKEPVLAARVLFCQQSPFPILLVVSGESSKASQRANMHLQLP